MNFKADDYLAHHGVKGMRWRKHKYKLVKGADGKYHYIYDDASSTSKKASIARQKNGNAAARKMQQETQAKRVLADVIKKGGDPNHSYTVGYTDKNGQHISGKYMPNEKSLSAVSFDKNGKVSPVYSKQAKELMADNKRKYDEHNRQERIRINKANEQQIKDRNNQKNAQKASYPSSVKRTQEEAAIKRKKADSYRLADPRVESVEFYKDLVPGIGTVPEKIAVPKKIFRKGAYSLNRGGLRVTPSEETKKRLRRNKRKKTVADVKRFINGLVNGK